MKKSLIAMALMFGAVVFVLPSCNGNKDEAPKTYTCSCDATSSTIGPKSGLTEAEKNAYIQNCEAETKPASIKGGATPKQAAQATCN
jgi:hypothetical protein